MNRTKQNLPHWLHLALQVCSVHSTLLQFSVLKSCKHTHYNSIQNLRSLCFSTIKNRCLGVNHKCWLSSVDTFHFDVVVCPVIAPESMKPKSRCVLPLRDPIQYTHTIIQESPSIFSRPPTASGMGSLPTVVVLEAGCIQHFANLHELPHPLRRYVGVPG